MMVGQQSQKWCHGLVLLCLNRQQVEAAARLKTWWCVQGPHSLPHIYCPWHFDRRMLMKTLFPHTSVLNPQSIYYWLFHLWLQKQLLFSSWLSTINGKQQIFKMLFSIPLCFTSPFSWYCRFVMKQYRYLLSSGPNLNTNIARRQNANLFLLRL